MTRNRRSRPSRRALVVGTILLGVLGVFAGWRLWVSGDDEPRVELTREGSVERPAEVAALELAAQTPKAYRIQYRVTEAAVSGEQERGATVSTEEHWVRRPFDSRSEQRQGDEITGAQETSLGRFAVVGGSSTEPTVLAVGPALAGADLRLAPVLDDALQDRLIESREQREVGGTPCQVYRVGEPVAGGTLAPPVSDGEYVDACFDRRGLLLEEWWVLDGRPFRQRLATEVTVGPVDQVDLMQLPQERTMPLEKGGGSIRPIDPASAPPGPFYDTTEVPSGFSHAGRFSVVPPQAEAFSDPDRREEIIGYVSDVWVRGPDLLIVDQGGMVGTSGQALFSDPEARREQLRGLGDAEVAFSLRGTELRVNLPGGRFVRIVGTLPLEELLLVGRGLQEGEGNEMLFLDDEP